MVAETGNSAFDEDSANKSQSPSCVVCYRFAWLRSAHSHFGRHRLKKGLSILFSALTQRATLVVLITRKIANLNIYSKIRNEKRHPLGCLFVSGCGDRDRTCDLRVMSPTSCLCSTPRYLSRSLFDRLGAGNRDRTGTGN